MSDPSDFLNQSSVKKKIYEIKMAGFDWVQDFM